MGLSMQEKKALTREISKRYQKAGKKEKTEILNELVKTTGYNRKYVLHVLANWGRTVVASTNGKAAMVTSPPGKRRKGGGRKPKYSGNFVIALRRIWAFFSYQCGKILAPFMRKQIGFLEGPFRITEKDKALLLSVSPSTIDRLLKQDREKRDKAGQTT